MITSSATSSKQHPHGPIQCYLLIYAALKVYRQYLTLFTLQKCSLTRWNIFYKYSSLTEHVNTISADNDLKARISDIVVVAYNSILLWAFKLGSKTTFFADSRKFHKFESFINSICTTTIVTAEMVKAVLVEKCTVPAYRLSINVFSAG